MIRCNCDICGKRVPFANHLQKLTKRFWKPGREYLCSSCMSIVNGAVAEATAAARKAIDKAVDAMMIELTEAAEAARGADDE